MNSSESERRARENRQSPVPEVPPRQHRSKTRWEVSSPRARQAECLGADWRRARRAKLRTRPAPAPPTIETPGRNDETAPPLSPPAKVPERRPSDPSPHANQIPLRDQLLQWLRTGARRELVHANSFPCAQPQRAALLLASYRRTPSRARPPNSKNIPAS